MQSIENLIRRFSQLEGKRDSLLHGMEQTKRELNENEARILSQERALSLIQDVAMQTQEQLNYRISEVATEAFAAILPDPYELHVNMEVRYGRTEAHLVFRRDGEERGNPMRESGGGAVDIAAFSLRVSLLMLNGSARKLLVLDEPFRNLSREYQEVAGALIRNLSCRLGIQFIIVTHDPAIADSASNVIEIGSKGNNR